MSQLLQSGENIPIASFSGTIIVSHDIDHQLDINLTAFLLTEFGKVQDDRGVIFYNHPEDPSGVATFIPPVNFGNTRNHKINFNLRRVPIGITKIAITLTEDKHSAGFAVTKNLKAEVHICEDIVTLIPSTFTTEKGIIVLELYIRNEQPKVKSVWQGFSSGLHGLCNYYGVQVDDDPCSSSAMPFNASSGSTSNMENIDFNGQVYDLHTFSGNVIETSKRSQTVYTESDSRVIDHGHIRTTHSTRTTNFNDVVVRNSLGKEHHLKLINWNFSSTVGNEIRFFWIDHKSDLKILHQNDKSYLAIKNYTTDEVVYNEDFIGMLFYGGYLRSFGLSLFVLNIHLIILCVVVGAIFFHISENMFSHGSLLQYASISVGTILVTVYYVKSTLTHIKKWRMARDGIQRVKHELYCKM